MEQELDLFESQHLTVLITKVIVEDKRRMCVLTYTLEDTCEEVKDRRLISH